jgi:hypothetical protein
MRHLLIDWKHWTVPERIAAVALAFSALMIPAALATMV